MKKLFFIMLFAAMLIPSSSVFAASKSTPWKPATPDGYSPISWVKEKGIVSFMKAPAGNGHIDYLTIISLTSNHIRLVASTTPRADWGLGKPPFDTVADARDWAFAKAAAEATKHDNPDMKFMWNVPFFNVTIPTSDLSLALRSVDDSGAYITSGSRPDADMAQARKMLIVDNKKGTATIEDFDPVVFNSAGDQAVEGFAASVTYKGTDEGVARLFLGVKPGGKELVVYCSNGASPEEASEALMASGVPEENQLQADGGTSATCGYGLPGQYFVEPGRTLPHLMGAFSVLYRGIAAVDGLNVRKGPGSKNAIVKTLKKNDPVMVYEEKNGWYRIAQNQEWVSAKLVKKL